MDDNQAAPVACVRSNHKGQRLTTRFLLYLSVLSVALSGVAWGRTARSLTSVKKIYVGSLGSGKGADTIRQRIVQRLQSSHRVEITRDAAQADATLTGTALIWLTGHISSSVRDAETTSQGVYDGYVSAELQGKGGAPLWSYLVTPSRLPLKGITSDLADQIAKKLIDALLQQTQETPQQSPNESGASVSLHGAGATFPWPIYQKWFESFEQKDPRVHIDYDPVGSQAGIQQLSEGRVDFGASDMPVSDEAMGQSPVRFLHFATVLGAVVPIYNLKNADRYLSFTPQVLAGIYLGTIKKWNDPAIRSANPGINLPDEEIVVVHRSDGSGTTFVWTDYLSKVSADWKGRVGAHTQVRWPVGRGAERNDGVATLVRQTPNSIGYVELIYAIQNEIRFGTVRNASGNFIRADLSSVTAAAASLPDSPSADFRVSITNAQGKQAYPISTFTWLLAPVGGNHVEKTAALRELLRWMLTSGQKQCAGLGYAPLPSAVASRELQLLDSLK